MIINKEEKIKLNLACYMRVIILLTIGMILFASCGIDLHGFQQAVIIIYPYMKIVVYFFQILFLCPFIYHLVKKRFSLYKPFFISYVICFIINDLIYFFSFGIHGL